MSGDVLLLEASSGKLLDLEGEQNLLQARFHRLGRHRDWQKFLIEKKKDSGMIKSGDVVYLRAHTEKYLYATPHGNVTGQTHKKDKLEQEFVIERVKGPGSLVAGDSVYFLAKHHSKFLSAMDNGQQVLLGSHVRGPLERFVVLKAENFKEPDAALSQRSTHKWIDLKNKHASQSSTVGLQKSSVIIRSWLATPCTFWRSMPASPAQ
jgi:hypothetical protein